MTPGRQEGKQKGAGLVRDRHLENQLQSRSDRRRAHPLWGGGGKNHRVPPGKTLRVTALRGPAELGAPLKRGRGHPISLKVAGVISL